MAIKVFKDIQRRIQLGNFNRQNLPRYQALEIERLENRHMLSGGFGPAIAFGSAGPDTGSAVTTDKAGNVYLTGSFSGKVDFDPGPAEVNLTSAGFEDIFVSKFSSEGDLVWAKSMGGANLDTGLESGIGIAVDGAGNVYTTGIFQGTADFDPGPGTLNLTSTGGVNAFISKLNSNGDFVWAKRIGGTASTVGRGITLDAGGNVYTTGYFLETADFDPGPGTISVTSVGLADVFVSKLDTNGTYVSVSRFGGTEFDAGTGITVDGLGNVLLTGVFMGIADFDPGIGKFELTSAGDLDVFVSKLTSTGNLSWAKRFGGAGQDIGIGITLDKAGNVYTTGQFVGIVDFDPGLAGFDLISNGDSDIFISKLTQQGVFVSAKNMGGTSSDNGTGIAVDAAGNVYTTGSFNGTADFDPSVASFELTSAGFRDIFVAKFDSRGDFVWAKNMGGINSDSGTGIAVDAAGNVYTTGAFNAVADFDSGPDTENLTSFGDNDIFVMKLLPQDGYSYQATAVPFVFEDISLTGTAISNFSSQDDGTAELTAAMLGGFAFEFYGTVYNNLFVSTNGLISFGSAFASLSNSNLTTETQAIIAPLWDDLRNWTGKVFWQVKEIANQKRLIIQWDNWDYYSGNTGADITFQLVLNAYDHSIQFNYKDLQDTGDLVNTEGSSATVGIKDAGPQGRRSLVTAFNNGPNLNVGSQRSVKFLDNTIATYAGTSANDLVAIDVSGDNYVVNLNGIRTILDASLVRKIKVDAMGGEDRITINGGAGNEAAILNKGNVIVTSSGVRVTATSVEFVAVNAGTGFDTAILRDSSGNDTFVATPAFARMVGTGFNNLVNGFDRVEGRAVVGNAGGAGDTALLIDSAGNDIFVSSPTSSQLTGTGFNNFANGFDRVEGRASQGNAGGVGDRATLFDSSGNDIFVAMPDKGQMLGSGFNNIATSFDRVEARATAGNTGGVGDRATLFDSSGNDLMLATPAFSRLTGNTFNNIATGFNRVEVNASGEAGDRSTFTDSTGNDVFVAFPTTSRMLGTGFNNIANGFTRVEAQATAGNAGGVGDKASLFDSPGNDIFVSSPLSSQMTGTGFNNFANGFDRVDGKANAGNAGGVGDRATLVDSAGNDTFLATPQRGQMLGAGFNNIAIDFDRVEGQATAGNAGGLGDRALFFDSAGNDIFVATPTSGQLVGTGFNNIATGFGRVEARAVVGNMGGAGDRATLFDSSGNDVFVATPAYGRMTGSGYTNIATSFDFVEAKATAGDAGGVGDKAVLYDSSGNDTFLGMKASSRLFGNGFLNIATGFDQVLGLATAGGVSDVAILHDSVGNDLFRGRNDNGVLSGVGFSNSVTGFDQVTANAFNGGNDTLDNRNLVYTFNQFGSWENIV